MNEKGFKLIPVDFIPEKGYSMYKDIVLEFAKDSPKEQLVQVGSAKPKSIRIGLRKAIKSLDIDVKEVIRKDEVYLVKD